MRTARVRLVAMAAVFLLGGCSVVQGMLDTEDALRAKGFRGVEVTFDYVNGESVVEVDYDSALSGPAAEVEFELAARTVWEVAPLRLDALTLRAHDPTSDASSGPHLRNYIRAELAHRFGPRPVAERPFSELIGFRQIKLVIGIGLGVLVLIIIVVVVAVRSGRKNRPPAYAGYLPGAWSAGTGWPQPGWPPQPPAGNPDQPWAPPPW